MCVNDKLANLKTIYETYKEEFFDITQESVSDRITSNVTPTLLRMAKIVVENGKSIKDFYRAQCPTTITLTNNDFQFSSSAVSKVELYINQTNPVFIEMCLKRKTIKLNNGATLFFLNSVGLKADSNKQSFNILELGTMDIALLYAFNELYNALFDEVKEQK